MDPFVCHTEAVADIVILVDGSWSIGRINFRLVRLFLENLVNAFDIGIDKTRIGPFPSLCPSLNLLKMTSQLHLEAMAIIVSNALFL